MEMQSRMKRMGACEFSLTRNPLQAAAFVAVMRAVNVSNTLYSHTQKRRNFNAQTRKVLAPSLLVLCS